MTIPAAVSDVSVIRVFFLFDRFYSLYDEWDKVKVQAAVQHQHPQP